MKIYKTSYALVFSQSHYTKKVLEIFWKCDDNPRRTPINVNFNITKNNRIYIYPKILDQKGQLNQG